MTRCKRCGEYISEDRKGWYMSHLENGEEVGRAYRCKGGLHEPENDGV